MRRALGLDGNSTPVTERPQPAASLGDRFHRRSKFVRDGQAPVEVIHRSQHPANGDGNPLDAARQTIRALTAAKERSERLLTETQAQVRDLQTKLGHERLAKDEVISSVEADRKAVELTLQAVRLELSAEMVARERSEQALRDARSSITSLTEKLNHAEQASATVKAELAIERQQVQQVRTKPIPALHADAPANGDKAVQTISRPRGRPRKRAVAQTFEKPARKPREKPVKWWLGER